jgi:hypothetical protein
MPPTANEMQQERLQLQQQENRENGGPQQQAMGPQSQRRLTLKERTHQLQSNNKKRKGVQQTLYGQEAFEPLKHCEPCKAKKYGLRVPHRPHHPLCWNNRRTGGITSKATLDSIKEMKRQEKVNKAPLKEHERFSWRHSDKESGAEFFRERRVHDTLSSKHKTTTTTTMGTTARPTLQVNTAPTVHGSFSAADTEKVNDFTFLAEHSKSRSPVAIMALASIVVERIVRGKEDLMKHFDGLTFTVPSVDGVMDPHYHSIVGQKLLLVDWKKMFGLDVSCPRCGLDSLTNDRTNFSKNRVLRVISGI